MSCTLRNFAAVASLTVLTAVAASVRAQPGPARPSAKPVAVSFPAAPAAAAAQPPAQVAPQGAPLFASVLAAIESRQSIAARVRHRIDLFDHQLVGSGIYLQQSLSAGSSRSVERMLRYELKIQVDDQVTSLLQIGDGNTLWVYEDLLGKVSLSQISLQRLRGALNSQERPNVAPATAWIMLGGLPKLLKSLGDWYEFTSVEEGRLDRLPVWVLRGKMSKEKLAALLPDQKDRILAGATPVLDRMPHQVPDRVVLMIGRDDLFPYRMEYWRLLPGEKKPLSLKKPPPADRMLLGMELFEVQFDVPLDPQQFVYNPGDLPKTDGTVQFLQSLGLKDVAEASAPGRKRR